MSSRPEKPPPLLEHDAQLVPIASLKPYKGNARIHDLDVIRESLRINGQYRPIVVRVKTREVLAGNGTMEAAQAEGWDQIWATFIDCDARAGRRINAVDNAANDRAGYDVEALVAQLQALPNLEGTGYDQASFDALVNQIADLSKRGTDTAPTEPPKAPRSKLGDVYELGAHRLICGDATDADVLDRLLEGGGRQSDLHRPALWHELQGSGPRRDRGRRPPRRGPHRPGPRRAHARRGAPRPGRRRVRVVHVADLPRVP